MYSRQPTNKDRDAKSGTIYDGSGALAIELHTPLTSACS